MAEGTMGGTGAEIYACPLEAQPHARSLPTSGGRTVPESPSPSGSWTSSEGPRPPSRQLTSAPPYTTGDWGLPADIARYRATVNRVNEGSTPPARASLDSLGSCWESLDLIAGRLGGAGAPSRLAHLRYVADIVPAEPRDRGNQQGRRGRGRVARGRAPV